MKEKILSAVKSPSFSILIMIIIVFILSLCLSAERPRSPAVETAASAIETTTAKTTAIITTTSSSTTTVTSTTHKSTVTSTTTSQTTSTSTTTTMPVTTEEPPPPAPLSPYINVGESPNSGFYQERLAIAGDSIAYGFYVYGLIPSEHNIAKESVSMWNLEYFTFNYGYGDMGIVDAVDYIHPKLLYMSLGMNDVNMNSPDSYAGKYTDTILQILERVPDINIVVAGITPVSAESSFTSNENIRNYNYALENYIIGLGSSRVYYFDAYSIVADEYLDLRYDCSAGDGIHLATHCYSDFLNALFNFLDTTPVMEQIIDSENINSTEYPIED